MKKKRLDRDSWGFWHFPYYQMRVDIEGFHGLACLLELTDGEYCYWEMPIAGKMAVCGAGMKWLELIPDGKKRVITTKYLPDGRVSVWYVDIIENVEYDHDGVAVFTDKYLDVIFNPQGDVKIDDRDELDQAYESGELTKEQYDAALREGEEIVNELCADLPATEALCADILCHVTNRIANGLKQFKERNRHTSFSIIKQQNLL